MKDKRGSILVFEDCNVIFTKKGSFRGGAIIHGATQRNIILDGYIKFVTNFGKHLYKGYKIIDVPEDTPYYFKFLEDTIMIEFIIGIPKVEYDSEFRQLVKNSLEDK